MSGSSKSVWFFRPDAWFFPSGWGTMTIATVIALGMMAVCHFLGDTPAETGRAMIAGLSPLIIYLCLTSYKPSAAPAEVKAQPQVGSLQTFMERELIRIQESQPMLLGALRSTADVMWEILNDSDIPDRLRKQALEELKIAGAALKSAERKST